MFEMISQGLIDIDVNDQRYGVLVRPSDTLLFALRERLGLYGAKPSCENGDCGACTVLVDGWPVKSCLMLAAEAVGHKITTIEGLAEAPLQKAFIDNCAFQCGYCTSGFIMNGHALATLHPDADEYMAEEWMQSNICRCTGYEEIKNALQTVLNRPSQ